MSKASFVSGLGHSSIYKADPLRFDFGHPVTFERDPENKFDKNAIKVICGEEQLGWIPAKKDGHENPDKTEMAGLMDEGYVFEGQVVLHDTARGIQDRMVIEIWAFENEEEGTEI